MTDRGRVLALVTGAGRGIGRATARRLADQGFDLALCALEVDEAEAVADEVRALGRRADARGLDVADPAAIEAYLDEVAKVLGPVSILVNNAGTIELPDGLDHASEASWDHTLAVNARAPFSFCRRLVPGMVERGYGRVVNVASTAGLRGLPHRLTYCSSKHALVGFTRALAEEVRTTGVTVNAVCPGAVRTRLTEGSRPDADRRGWLDPDDVARTITFLVGPDGGHHHGSVLELADRS